jgi:3-methyladenine DNA glycosylase AlkC
MQGESALATIQRQQIEIALSELLLTDDHYIRQTIIERLRHQITHADPSFDVHKLSDWAQEELEEVGLIQ